MLSILSSAMSLAVITLAALAVPPDAAPCLYGVTSHGACHVSFLHCSSTPHFRPRHIRFLGITDLVFDLTSVSYNDAVHVGCFKTNLVDTQRSYYMIDEPLMWENGISACIHRYTTHVGVQADNRTSSKNYFFCGNDLLEHSVKLEDSACSPCVNPADRHCGGPQSLSIYKIRDSTPLVIYAAAYEGIRLLEVDGSHTNYTSPIQTATSASRITTLYSKDEIVFQNYVGGDLSKYLHYLNV